jgi:hypothetical protein
MKKEKRKMRNGKSRTNSRRVFFAFFFFHFSLFFCHAFDFGLITSQYVASANPGTKDADFEYRADIMPRLLFLFGDTGKLSVSAGMTLGIADGFYYVPELLGTEFTFQSGNWEFTAGRMQYTDPLGFIASGLFDGARLTHASKAGVFGVGAWYTGLLYKKNAIITMTAWDQASYDSPILYNDFLKTYFAPRRLLAALDWEHPSIMERLLLKAALVVQADLSSRDEKYHSQYAVLKASVPINQFMFELGGSFEAAESKNFNIAFAWDFGVFWTPPANFNSRLSLTGHFTGGNTGGFIAAFVPVTGKFYGDILKVKLSGISILSLDYTARFIDTLSASLTVSHLIRNDQGTYAVWPASGANNSGYSLGTELFARVVWSPVSDLNLNLGGGAFFPVLGNVNPKERAQWLIELGVIYAVY